MSLIARSLPRRTLPSALKSSLSKSLLQRHISTRELDEAKGERERIVILGSGWAGFVLSRTLNPKKYQVVVVAPRSYFVFTPLLASTAVGTLEFRTTLESVRDRHAQVEFFQGWADDVSFYNKTVTVEEAATDDEIKPHGIPPPPGTPPTITDTPRVLVSQETVDATRSLVPHKRGTYQISYDKLVVAVGCYSQTFGTKGVREHAFFLKDIAQARKIRKQILKCFETAASPSTSEDVRNDVLNFAIVGGGPTGIEFAAELHDLIHEDLIHLYPTLIPLVRISVYDVAPKILSMFDASLASYATQKYDRDGIKIKTEHHIQELRPGRPGSDPNDYESSVTYTLVTKEEGEVGIGMCVWSTGLMMNPFIAKAMSNVHTFPALSATLSTKSISPAPTLEWSLQRHPKTGGLMVNDKFQVLLSNPQEPNVQATMHDVFALGDVSSLRSGALPATAQVANQEGKWLGKILNGDDIESQEFAFKNLGVMAYLGNKNAIMQAGEGSGLSNSLRNIKGRTAWAIWRGAYLTRTVSWRNKILIPVYWTINWILGRDTSRF